MSGMSEAIRKLSTRGETGTRGETSEAVFWVSLNILSAVAVIFCTKSVFSTLHLNIPITLTGLNFITMYFLLHVAQSCGVFQAREFDPSQLWLRVLLTALCACSPLIST